MPAEPVNKPRTFYQRVRPPALLWGPVAAFESDRDPHAMGEWTCAQYLLAATVVFSGMFALGKLVLGETLAGLALAVLSVTTAGVMLRWAFGTAPQERQS